MDIAKKKANIKTRKPFIKIRFRYVFLPGLYSPPPRTVGKVIGRRIGRRIIGRKIGRRIKRRIGRRITRRIGRRIGRKIGRRFLRPILRPSSDPSSSKSYSIGNLADEGRRTTKVLNLYLFQGGEVLYYPVFYNFDKILTKKNFYRFGQEIAPIKMIYKKKNISPFF